MKNSKKVLITGSSSGIGAAIANRLSLSGHRVFLTGRDSKKLKKQAKSFSAEGFISGDLLEDNFIEELFKIALHKLGNIDVLINNAGAYMWSPIEKTGYNDIEKILKLNLEVPYKLCKLVVPGMKERKLGKIINIGSISGAVGEANASLYSTSKSGLTGMTKALALELAEYGISVNIINPGWVKTPLAETYLDNESVSEEEELEMIPQKRWIDPYEVAGLVNYLITDEASGITGQSINLCCGLSLG